MADFESDNEENAGEVARAKRRRTLNNEELLLILLRLSILTIQLTPALNSYRMNAISAAVALWRSEDGRGGSLPGRIKAYDRRAIVSPWWRDFLPVTFDPDRHYPELMEGRTSPHPILPSRRFHEVFRVPYELFVRIHADFREAFDSRRDAVGLIGHRAPIKIMACLRSFGQDSSLIDGECASRIAPSTLAEFRKTFIRLVLEKYESEFLIPPASGSDRMQRLSRQYEGNGLLGTHAACMHGSKEHTDFAGCVGALDCTHVQWKNCPKAAQGCYRDRDGNCAIIVQVILVTWFLYGFYLRFTGLV